MSHNRELDQLEQQILKVAGSSQDRLTVEELSLKLDVSPDEIFEKLNDEEFSHMFVEAVGKSFIPDLPEIARAFTEQAKSGHFKHGKLIFEIVGLYKEKSEVDTNFGISESVANVFEDKDARKAFVEATLGKFKDGEGEGSDNE